jgi:hypothetical protein
MRRTLVLVVLAAAGCTSGHRDAVPPTTTTVALTATARAEKLCRAKLPESATLFSSAATTVGAIRSTTIATQGPTQFHQFPTLGREHFAAWCWTRDGDTFTVYKAAAGEKIDAVARETGIDPSSAHGAPQVP